MSRSSSSKNLCLAAGAIVLVVSTGGACSRPIDTIGTIAVVSPGGVSGEDVSPQQLEPDVASGGATMESAGGMGGQAMDPPGCVAGLELRQRPESAPVIPTGGTYRERTPTQWQLISNGESVTLVGQGYIALRWNVEYTRRAGEITPPEIEVLSGTFLRVGGGGEMNLGDARENTEGTWLGNETEGLSFMPEGVEPPWQNEFYYLDGQVTIVNNEAEGLYNITVYQQTYDDVVSEGWGVYAPGVVCDPA